MIQRYLLILFLSLGLFARSSAQVVINEFCVANYSNYALSGEYEDWVEFYNPGATAYSLSGYFLSDDPLNPSKYTIPAGVSVPANGYKIILFSGTGAYDPTYLGQTNTNFKITQTAGESIVFSTPTSSVLESYSFNTFSPNQANHSWARTTNGGTDWTIHTSPTPGASNSGATGIAYAAKPTFSLQAGYYASAINVTISTTEPNSSIYYTLDGTMPTAASTLYTGPIGLSTTTPLRAIAISTDPTILPSFVKTNTYFFGADQHTVRVIEITGATLGDGWWSGDELTTLEMFAPGGVFLEESHGDSNEHGNDSNAYPQKGFDYITRDELGYDNAIEYPVFHISDRPSYQRVIFKAAANDNYPSETGGAHIRDAYVHQLSIDGNLQLDERKTEHCVVYINGVYWGVYEIREKMDDTDFTDYYYNQPNGFVDMLKTWGGTWAEYGSSTDWDALVAFITSNDMTVQTNYDYVTSQLNTLSLIDYFILNGYVVCTDWLNWNTQWWRGRNPAGDAKKWKYSLWDDDATFGHYINYTGVDSTDPTADPCQIENQGNIGGQGHVPVLNALFTNDQFTADYVQRYAALSNTIFSCDRMIEVLDSMIAVIEPEMNRHTQRWGGSVAGWQANVQEIRDFISARCNTEIIGGLEDCYNVTAYNVTIEIDGVGHVFVGTMPLNETTAPFTGFFFADLPIALEVPNGTCGTFAGWEITSGTGTIVDASNPLTSFTLTSDVTFGSTFRGEYWPS